MCGPCFVREEYFPAVAPSQWRDKGEELTLPMEHEAYIAKPEYIADTKKRISPPAAGDVKAKTYYSFFRWSGQTEWTPERMGQKFIPRVIIWDKVCTMARLTMEIVGG